MIEDYLLQLCRFKQRFKGQRIRNTSWFFSLSFRVELEFGNVIRVPKKSKTNPTHVGMHRLQKVSRGNIGVAKVLSPYMSDFCSPEWMLAQSYSQFQQ